MANHASATGDCRRPKALFLGSTYAGHATRFASLRRHVEQDDRLDATFAEVTGWRPGGRIESLEFVPKGLRGRVRATLEASAVATWPRPDFIWTSASEVLAPFLWSQVGPLRRPLVLDLDATWEQLDAMAPHYKGRPPRSGLVRRQALVRERLLFSRVTLFTPWSEWAADGLRAAGVPDPRIRVIPPGVDLDIWRRTYRPPPGERLRLLFVGGNFVRKGGDMLLDVMASPLGERLELDIVTRDPVQAGRNVRVHRLEQGDPRLKELYERADLFVMPSRGECFGIATVEAMAAGLPVLVSNVGAAREIVADGQFGWLVAPSLARIAGSLTQVLESRERLAEIGQAARSAAEARFNGEKNHRRVVAALLAASGSRIYSRQSRRPETIDPG